jgi:hypothetical protein
MAISPQQAAATRRQLAMLAADATDPRIRQMARDLVAGKTDLRSALLGPTYEHALNDATARFSSWYVGLSDQQRAEQEQRGRDYAEQQLREHEQAATEVPAPPRRTRTRTDGHGDDEWGPPTILRRR